MAQIALTVIIYVEGVLVLAKMNALIVTELPKVMLNIL